MNFLFFLFFHHQKSPGKIKVALYNITADPAERVDLSKKLPNVVRKLRDRVRYYKKGVVPPEKKRGNPKARRIARVTGYWGPWRG